MYFPARRPRRPLLSCSYGLAAILVLLGTKMLIVEWFKIPVVLVSLSVVATILAVSVFASLWCAARQEKEAARINAG